MVRNSEQIKCASCNREIGKLGVIFKCPSCLKNDLARCVACKNIAAKYKCECDFTGP